MSANIVKYGVLCALFAVTSPLNGQVIKLLPDDGAAFDHFGSCVAIDNGIVAVGATSDDDNGSFSGSAYLFDAATGLQIAKLLPDDGAAGDQFGWSIAIHDGTIAVGAYYDNDNGDSSGSAYLFDAATGLQIAKLLPDDGAAFDHFGQSIAIHNGIVAVGAVFGDDNGTSTGSAYLFDADTGLQIAKLLPDDGAAGDHFGQSIAIHNGIVAVGAVFGDDNGTSTGSAYLFDADTGLQIAKLLPDDGAAGDQFGWSIAIHDGIVAVGALYHDDNGAAYGSGSAYLFDAATGLQTAKLIPVDGATHPLLFGISIAIDSGIVAAGARTGVDYVRFGKAFLFDAATGLQIAKLKPGDGGDDKFAESIAIDSGILAAGNEIDHDNQDSGSAYVFDVVQSCPADLTTQGTPQGDPSYGVPDGFVSTADIQFYVNLYVADHPDADLTTQGAPLGDPDYGVPDGFVSTADIQFYVNLYVAGCP